MSLLTFYKYQGTGNDFVIIDNRNGVYQPTTEKNRWLCDRKFGIGADGLICLNPSDQSDFYMLYFNSDGNESTMCGNGGRCMTAFAKKIGLIQNQTTFHAIDGIHEAKINDQNWVELKMMDVEKVENKNGCYILNTGSPHYIEFVENVEAVDVDHSGANIRYSEPFKAEGINVNFVEIQEKGIEVATYERGVEGETLSCGTGVTAAAIAYGLKKNLQGEVPIRTKGGNLAVKFEQTNNGFQNVWLCGPATFVYKATIKV
jgi:diaminopimelate epimerase